MVPSASSPLDAADLRVRVQRVVDEVLSDQARVLATVSDDLTPCLLYTSRCV